MLAVACLACLLRWFGYLLATYLAWSRRNVTRLESKENSYNTFNAYILPRHAAWTELHGLDCLLRKYQTRSIVCERVRTARACDVSRIASPAVTTTYRAQP